MRNIALEVSSRPPELNPTNKRLLLSAYLNLVCKKLRRGASVEEREILALLPFTVSNGSQRNDEPRYEICGPMGEKAVDASDEDWSQRVAEAGALR